MSRRRRKSKQGLSRGETSKADRSRHTIRAVPIRAVTGLDPPPFRYASAVICIGLVVLIFAIYGQVAGHKFLVCDDDDYVSKNPQVLQGLSWAGVQWAFSGPHAGNYHPLTWISHMADVSLFEMDPGDHHLVNVTIHAMSSLLLFLALRAMTGSFWPPTVVAAIFALHPLRVESVAWVAERKDVLGGLFWMIVLVAYSAFARRGGLLRYACVFTALGMGLLCKSMLVTLPCVLMLLDLWPLRRWSRQGSTESRDTSMFPQRALPSLILEKVPLLLLSVATSVEAVYSQSVAGAMNSLTGIPLGARVANALVSYVAYLEKTVWPSGLAIFYPHPMILDQGGSSILWVKAAAAAALLLVITAVAIVSISRRPYLTVGWFWYFGTLVPVAGLVQVGTQAMADRYTYLPLIGIFIIVAWGGKEIVERWPLMRSVTIGVSVIAGVALMAVSWRQVGHWKTSHTLFRHAADVTERNYFAYNHIGLAFEEENKREEAKRQFERAIEVLPNYDFGHNNLSVYYARKDMLEQALHHLKIAIASNPSYVDAISNLGVVYERMGRLQEAEQQHQTSIRLDHTRADSYFNLGVVHAKMNRLEDALDNYRQALALNPQLSEAARLIGIILLRQKKLNEAQRHLENAVHRFSGNSDLFVTLGAVYAEQKQFHRAQKCFMTALRIDPQHADAKTGLETIRNILKQSTGSQHDE